MGKKKKATKKKSAAKTKTAKAKSRKSARSSVTRKKSPRKAGPKKAKKSKAVAKKPAAKRAQAPAKDETTEIVFSYAEIDFLRKITGKDVEPTSPKDRRARLSLRDKLLDINFNAPTAGAGGLIVLDLFRREVQFLQRITKEVYSFITAEERRARLILREKILIAVEKVTGKRLLSG